MVSISLCMIVRDEEQVFLVIEVDEGGQSSLSIEGIGLAAGDILATIPLDYEQTAMLGGSTIAGNPYDLTLLPDVNFPGGDLPFEWETIAPRIGVTYALGDERKTLLRASYARFPQQLDCTAPDEFI